MHLLFCYLSNECDSCATLDLNTLVRWIMGAGVWVDVVITTLTTLPHGLHLYSMRGNYLLYPKCEHHYDQICHSNEGTQLILFLRCLTSCAGPLFRWAEDIFHTMVYRWLLVCVEVGDGSQSACSGQRGRASCQFLFLGYIWFLWWLHSPRKPAGWTWCQCPLCCLWRPVHLIFTQVTSTYLIQEGAKHFHLDFSKL